MSAEHITSRSNPLVAHIRRLGSSREYRRERGEFVCDGDKLLREAVTWGAELLVLLAPEGAVLPKLPEGVRVVLAPEELVRWASPLATSQGTVFVCRMPGGAAPRKDGGRYIVLEGVQDPGNVGTVIRTADAFAMDGVILTGGCADPYNPKTVRATMGALFRRRVLELTLPELEGFVKERRLPLYAAALAGETRDVRELELSRAAVAVGNEGAGISRELLAHCAGSVRIPMAACCESLNAGVAASVLMWEMSRKAL